MSSSSQDSESSRRCCPKCSIRISSFAFDRHFLCSVWGYRVDDSIRCEVCIVWSKESFDMYLKHHKSLIAKSKSKAKKEFEPKYPSGQLDSSKLVFYFNRG